MHNGKKFLKFLTLAAVFVMVATIGMGTMAQAQPSNTELTLPFIGNPANVALNVTLSQISYITQPTQWLYSGNSHQKAYYTNSTAWVVPNSGDLFIVNNSTTATPPADSAVNFPVADSLGSPVNYMFADSRLSFNGTGETAYYLISESNQTTPPSSSGNVLKASAGSAQNVIDVIITEHNATTSTVSVGYFTSSDGGAYQNYTTYSFSSLYLNALEWYDFMVYIQSSGTVVSIMNTTGSILASSSTLTPVLDGNYSKITTVSYISAEAASTAGDMLILDYSYLVDHNTYQTSSPSAPLAGAIGASIGSVAPFDPGASVAANYTQSPSSANDYLSTNVSINDFTSVTNSSTLASEYSGLVNVSAVPGANATSAFSSGALADIRTATYLPSQVTTNLYVTTWTPAGINASIEDFLQGTIGGMLGVEQSDVTIIGYAVTSMGLDIALANSTMSEVGNYLYNAIPGILTRNNLSLVNTVTGAIQAGAMAGYFWDNGAIAAPVIKGGLITDPLTGYVYRSVTQAGFPTGSYIEMGAIYVPQWEFLGFASDGQPIFSNIPLYWNPFHALSGAASAVSSFFRSGASTISNAIKSATKTVGTTVSSTASKLVSSVGSGTSAINHALSTTASDIQKAAGDVMPFLAGSVGSIGKAISGSVTHAVTGVQSGLADVKSSVTGAVLAGVSTVKQGLSNIGTAIVNTTKTASGKIAATFENGLHYILPPVERVGNAIYTTLGTVGTTVKNVISPIVTTIHNLPTAIVNGTQTLVKGAQSLGQSIASDASNLGIAIKNGTMNALNTIGNTITSAGKEIQNEFGNITAAISGAVKSPFSFFAGLSNNVAHIVEYAAIGIAVVILVIAGIYVFSHNSKRGKGGHHRRK